MQDGLLLVYRGISIYKSAYRTSSWIETVSRGADLLFGLSGRRGAARHHGTTTSRRPRSRSCGTRKSSATTITSNCSCTRPPSSGPTTEAYPMQLHVNKHLRELAAKHGVSMVCTNDVHFVDDENAEAHDRLICLSTGKRPRRSQAHALLRSRSGSRRREEMAAIFGRTDPEAMATTRRNLPTGRVLFDRRMPRSCPTSRCRRSSRSPEANYRAAGSSEKDLCRGDSRATRTATCVTVRSGGRWPAKKIRETG